MTLSTNVYVLDEIDPRRVFIRCQQILQKHDAPRHRPPEAQECSERESWRGGVRMYGNHIDQGLPALLDVHFRPGAALTPEDPGHGDDCDEDCSGDYHDRVCWLDVDFDTAYGYRAANGWRCGDLHAAMVGELGSWLDEQGIRWEWRNESTGEVWGGDDRYARLGELGEAGAAASNWYSTVALPAILADRLTAEMER